MGLKIEPIQADDNLYYIYWSQKENKKMDDETYETFFSDYGWIEHKGGKTIEKCYENCILNLVTRLKKIKLLTGV